MHFRFDFICDTKETYVYQYLCVGWKYYLRKHWSKYFDVQKIYFYFESLSVISRKCSCFVIYRGFIIYQLFIKIVFAFLMYGSFTIHQKFWHSICFKHSFAIKIELLLILIFYKKLLFLIITMKIKICHTISYSLSYYNFLNNKKEK